MEKVKILWADDEIELLKPQILFLQNKGYDVVTVSNGYDALEECDGNRDFDVVFLDESMPGLTGLETLSRIKVQFPNLPVVMITKNEAETVMEEALGSQITDYLIKPVNPNQVLLTLKKIMDNKRLVREKTTTDYQQEFRQLMMRISSGLDINEWAEVYRKLVNWEIKIDDANSTEIYEILAMQKAEANNEFSKFITKNYLDWIADESEAPVLSFNLLRKMVLPLLKEGTPTILLLLDNLRYDQWKVIEPIVSEAFRVESEDFFFSILPTSTQYSRNAIFSGMMPSEIEKYHPDWWLNDNEKGGKNMYEEQLLAEQLRRIIRRPLKTSYTKVTTVAVAKEMQDNILHYINNDLTVIVYNFIDMLSHARTEMEVLKELAGDEKAYRSLTRSWFENSPLWLALQKAAERDVQLFITTDHGTIRVNQPSKVVGDRETTTNLRYKVGKNLQFEKRDVFAIREPEKAGLPRPNISSTYIFAKEDHFFLYPNNYNQYLNFYKNTFQHGGISLEEIICPVIRLRNR
ncbi:MAG: PglZ domain-containing protein [Saprospirales bacterium]|jgi:CheY-like chemotaxis protein|nr:PglZ domain-containing protein [Saprospirales bacterium]MBK6902177.1 PglZ domain-containing protein [Saprospirales bacterium]MBK7337346.1 PglZ domain-containing protein [Saprospirales bacterium]